MVEEKLLENASAPSITPSFAVKDVSRSTGVTPFAV
jgi:hypothetical protein